LIFPKALIIYFPLIPTFSLWRMRQDTKTFETINKDSLSIKYLDVLNVKNAKLIFYLAQVFHKFTSN